MPVSSDFYMDFTQKPRAQVSWMTEYQAGFFPFQVHAIQAFPYKLDRLTLMFKYESMQVVPQIAVKRCLDFCFSDPKNGEEMSETRSEICTS